MTTIQLYRKHKAGEISKEKFLYEVRRDNNLPFITNLTSYEDAVKILKNRGIVTEGQTKEAKADEAIKAEVKAKASSTKKPESLNIDQANPYEYRHGLQHELAELNEYTDEALEKAKDKVLKNLAKDANFYSNLLNQKPSPYEFKASETDAPGMQAKADGHLKKELKKDEKSNVQDSLGKKEEGSKKPKGIKVMPDKGVTGSEKTIKESIEEALPGETSNPEDEFNSLLSKYDWYYEMSDDPRTYDRGLELDNKLKVLGKQIGVDKAVELFNTKAPSDRKVTSTFFMEGKDKLSKIKEALKKALKKEAGEKTAFVTTQGGDTTAVDYKTPEELRKIGDNTDVRRLKTGDGKTIKGS